jgi:hypothetical protein
MSSIVVFLFCRGEKFKDMRDFVIAYVAVPRGEVCSRMKTVIYARPLGHLVLFLRRFKVRFVVLVPIKRHERFCQLESRLPQTVLRMSSVLVDPTPRTQGERAI